MKIYLPCQVQYSIFCLLICCFIPFVSDAQVYYDWARQGGGQGMEQSRDIVVDRDGNVYTAGVYESHSVFTPTPGIGDTLYHTYMDDIFVAKYDSIGNYQWAFRIIGDTTQSGNHNQIVWGMDVDSAGNIYLAGRIDNKTDFDPSEAPGDTMYLHSGNGTAFIAKYDGNGNLVWAKNFGGPTYVNANAIAVDDTGKVFLIGHFTGIADFDPSSSNYNIFSNGGYDLFVAHYDVNGDFVWANGFGNTGSEFGIDIEITDSNNIYIAGSFQGTVDFDPGTGSTNLTSGGGSDPIIAKYESSGSLVWAGNISGSGSEFVADLGIDWNNNIAVTGYFSGSADFDLSSSSYTLTSKGGQDAFLAHYEEDGDFNWAINPGNSGTDLGQAVVFNQARDVFLMGTFTGKIDFDVSGDSAFFESSNTDIYIAQYDEQGDYIWAGLLEGAGSKFTNGAASDTSGNIYLTGSFQSPGIDINPDTSANEVDLLPGIGGFLDVFTLKLNADSSSLSCTAYYNTIVEKICNGDSLLFAGNYYASPGLYYDSLSNSEGCDSILILDLSFFKSAMNSKPFSICSGDSILFQGSYYSTAGIYSDTLISSQGCDSIIILDLTVLPAIFDTTFADICNGDSILFGGNYYSTSGFYNDTMKTTFGCDSIITLKLNILNHYSTSIISNICQGDSLFFSGGYIHQQGVYYDSLLTQQGCDSVIVLQLMVLNNIQTTVNSTICSGDSLLFGNVYYSSGGTYFDSLQSQSGCDSIVTLNLVVSKNYNDVVMANICESDSFLFGNTYYNKPGSYPDSLLTTLGCDSVIVLQLTVFDEFSDTISESICSGDSILFGGQYISSSGFHKNQLQTSVGCDSIIILDLTVLNNQTTSLTEGLCHGDSIYFGGQYITSADIYNDTLQGANGCDSIISLDVYFKSNSSSVVDTFFHHGDSLFLNGDYITQAGTYIDTLTGINECDSIVTYHVEVIIGFDKTGLESIKIYPNPADGYVRLKGIEQPTALRIYDSQGRLLEALELYTSTHLDLSGYVKGIYLLSFTNLAEGSQKTWRLVIK